MSDPLWSPSKEYIEHSSLYAFQHFVENKLNLTLDSYLDLYNWSVDDISGFWECVLQFFNISYSGSYQQSVCYDNKKSDFIDTRWFEGILLSYSEHIFKQKTDTRPAVLFASEQMNYIEVPWKTLENKVSSLQQFLKEKGVEKGDRVVGVLNNTVDTLAIFLAVNSLGAIWSCCSPDFGDVSISERFEQIQPKVLFIETIYWYNNREFSKEETFDLLKNQLPTLTCSVVLCGEMWQEIFTKYIPKDLFFVRVPFSHPIWILYSSGTTGKPKAITHSTGGNLLEHYKALKLHQNVLEGEKFLWYSTTGWMMWNYSISSLLCGATLCIFDGAINHKRHYTFWNFLRTAKIDHLGAGAVYFSSLKDFIIHNYAPKVIGSTGSPLPVDTFLDLQSKFPDTHIISLSGGTDVCSAFLSGSPYLPVYAGQLQCRTLGSAIEAFNDEGNTVYDEVGELVILKPMPSMPVYFWNDTDNKKYKESYFDKFPNVWSHGDWIKISKIEGITIYGRSDATLNRDGVRIGTAEIYNAVNRLDKVKDSLVICVDYIDGSSKMLLFVQLEKTNLSDDLKSLIRTTLRSKYSPRHVPDLIFQVNDVPYTLSDKKLEIPIKKIFSGIAVEKAVSKDIMRNPESLQDYVDILKLMDLKN